MAKNLGIKIKYMHRSKLSKFCGNRPHQNVVLKCDRLEYENIRSMKDLIKLQTNENGELLDKAPKGKFYIFLD